MDKHSLVSIITPCYQGETYVHRFFESVLRQTYPNLELIFVNDGSRDKTEEIALSYRAALEEKGISYTYLFQENAGQAAAVNKALKLFRGDYLTWPDSDDWMSDDCIEKKVAYLESHPEKGFVMCQTRMVPESDLQKTVGILARKNTTNGWLFDDLISEHDVYYAPGGFMVRSKDFLQVLPKRHIYECKTGQNWQMLLPMAYRYECGFLNEVLYYYLVRDNSHSRAEKSYADQLERTYRHQDTLERVISEMDMTEQERADYLKKIRMKYLQKRLLMAREAEKREDALEFYGQLVQQGTAGLGARLNYWRIKYPVLEHTIRAVRVPWRMIQKFRYR